MSAKEKEETTAENEEQVVQENQEKTQEVNNEATESSDESTEEQATEQEITDDPDAKYNALNEKYLRLYSDFENFRRRNAKERLDLIKSAGEDIIKDLLPVLDDFERAIENNKKVDDAEAIKEGFSLLHHKFNSILTGKGVKEIDTTDREFDVNLHEAITKIPAPEKKLKGKIVDVVEKGYYLNDKVIRYSKVVIGE